MDIKFALNLYSTLLINKSMNLTPNIQLIDLAVWLKKQKTLVVADFHIGFEEALNKQGVLVPRFQYKDVIRRLSKIFVKVKPETIVVNGDLKHEFGRISEQEWREALKLADFLSKHCKKLFLTKGNHDKILGPIAKKRGIEVVDKFETGSTLILHGDKLPKSLPKCKTIIIGHEHPAVSLQERGRVEKFKCFLVGKYKGKTLIVQPSFKLTSEGTDVLKERVLSPFLKKGLGNFDVFVVADKIYRFGKVKYLQGE